jgi:hypothetical protein
MMLWRVIQSEEQAYASLLFAVPDFLEVQIRGLATLKWLEPTGRCSETRGGPE